jgi:hypothetical protein
MKIAPLRDAVFADVLFHEIGHHIHRTQAREFRGREGVADEWARRVGARYFSRRAWYLILFVRLLRLRRFATKINQYQSRA